MSIYYGMSLDAERSGSQTVLSSDMHAILPIRLSKHCTALLVLIPLQRMSIYWAICSCIYLTCGPQPVQETQFEYIQGTGCGWIKLRTLLINKAARRSAVSLNYPRLGCLVRYAGHVQRCMSTHAQVMRHIGPTDKYSIVNCGGAGRKIH